MADAMILAQWVVNVGRRDARTRIAHLLCEMAFRQKADTSSNKAVFNLPMTQAHLADATGLTAVHVNRTLMALREGGVQMRGGRVYVGNWEWLTRVGDFDPTYLQASVQPEQQIFVCDALG